MKNTLTKLKYSETLPYGHLIIMVTCLCPVKTPNEFSFLENPVDAATPLIQPTATL